MQLRSRNEPAAALERFETLFSMGTPTPRALALAGAVAFQVGGDRLPLAILFLEQAVSLPPDIAFPDAFPPEATALYAESLMHLGLAYAQSGRFPEAIARLAEAAVRLPSDPVITYNFACGLALAGRVDDAFVQLREAFALDPSLATHARTDSDLNALHGSPEWKQVLALGGSDAGASR